MTPCYTVVDKITRSKITFIEHQLHPWRGNVEAAMANWIEIEKERSKNPMKSRNMLTDSKLETLHPPSVDTMPEGDNYEMHTENVSSE